MSQRDKISSLKRAGEDGGVQNRRNRTENLREMKMTEHLAKRREMRMDSVESGMGMTSAPSSMVGDGSYNLDSIIMNLKSPNPSVVQEALGNLRSALGQRFISAEDFVSKPEGPLLILQHLQNTTNHKIQYDAAWCITSITSSSTVPTSAMVKAGVFNAIISQLGTPNNDILNQLIWAIGNISGDIPELRDSVINAGFVQIIVGILQKPNVPLQIVQTATWTLSNFARGTPRPDFEAIKCIVPVLANMLKWDDDEVLMNTAWAISFLTNEDVNQIQAIIDTGCVPNLIRLMTHPSAKVAAPCIRALGNATFGTEDQTDYLLQSGLCSAIKECLRCSKAAIIREAAWLVSNISAGPSKHVQILSDSGVLEIIIPLVNSASKEIRREAVWAVSNATCEATQDVMRRMVENGVVEAILAFLNNVLLSERDTAHTIVVALEGLSNILNAGRNSSDNMEETENPIAERIKRANGLNTIEELQSHKSTLVYEAAKKLLDDYFMDEDDEDEDEGFEY